MSDTDMISHEELLRMTTEVAAAYFSNNTLPSLQLPEVIKTIHAMLAKGEIDRDEFLQRKQDLSLS